MNWLTGLLCSVSSVFFSLGCLREWTSQKSPDTDTDLSSKQCQQKHHTQKMSETLRKQESQKTLTFHLKLLVCRSYCPCATTAQPLSSIGETISGQSLFLPPHPPEEDHKECLQYCPLLHFSFCEPDGHSLTTALVVAHPRKKPQPTPTVCSSSWAGISLPVWPPLPSLWPHSRWILLRQFGW